MGAHVYLSARSMICLLLQIFIAIASLKSILDGQVWWYEPKIPLLRNTDRKIRHQIILSIMTS